MSPTTVTGNGSGRCLAYRNRALARRYTSVTERNTTRQPDEPDKPLHRALDSHERDANARAQASTVQHKASRPWGGPSPIPRGSGPAYQAVGEVASPLLAGFSVTLIGVIAQSPATMRWPGFSLTLLTLAAAFLLAAVQCGFHARQHFWTREDLLAWYVELTPASDQAFAKEHQRDTESWDRWVNRTRRFYNLGICTLAAAVATVVSPPQDSENYTVSVNEEVWRWTAASLAVFCLLIEVCWWLRSSIDDTGSAGELDSTNGGPVHSGDSTSDGSDAGPGEQRTTLETTKESEESDADD